MNFIRINMTTQEAKVEPAPQVYTGLGGRGLTSKFLVDEVNPRCYALGEDNKVIIAPGLLTGTSAPSTGRTSIGAKSPLTGTIKESNVGGLAGQYLAGHGIKAVVIEGLPKARHSWVLIITGQKVKFEVKGNLAGLGNYEAVEKLRAEYGEKSAVICVGPAGEAGAAVATIAVSDMEGRPARHAGRGGMGAVLASKGIKAIVIARPDKQVVEAAKETEFKEKAKEFAKALSESKKGLTTYGTAMLVNAINAVGGLPTRNFSSGHNDKAEDIGGEKLHQLCTERGGSTGHACSRGCAIRCSNIFHDAEGNYVTSGLEYETIALLGSNCGLNDLDGIARLDRLCDDLGIDTMEMGGALGVAMEAGALPFGDFERMTAAVTEVAHNGSLGRVLGQGATVTGRMFGVERVPAVKGQSMSAYDPRALKGTGVTYATSTMGADHTAGNALPGRGGLKPDQVEGQIALSRNLQVWTMVCDILGVCIFVGPLADNMPVFASLVSSFTGERITEEMLSAQACEILKAEQAFNSEAGIGATHNDVPSYFRTEPLPNNGLVFDIPTEELKNFGYNLF
ncbi:aldehyde ferredoxin oxidoreductase C-terminal domain-containing protein [Paradesulfitobacterium aromaticivorans]